jgi:Domain of unknown function (DUF1906)
MTGFAKAPLCILAATLCTAANSASAGPLEDGRLAIIHTNESVLVDDRGRPRSRDFLTKLKEIGVHVIGRYYGRCLQPTYPYKLLVKGGSGRDSEATAILEAGFAIISFYQYKTSDDTAEDKFIRGLPEQYDPEQCEQTDYAKSHPVPHSGADEGALDAEAAAAQAHAVHQPSNTPIYFGMDFEYTKAEKPQLDKGVIAYFKAVREVLSKPENNYLVGAYGDGDMLTVLLGLDKQINSDPLIEFAWLSPSRGYPRTSEFTRSGRWHVLQSISDTKVIYPPAGACIDYAYDGDIQNKAAEYEYAGAWNRLGRYVPPLERTKAIYDQHGYICSISGVSLGAHPTSCADNRAADSCTDFCSARVVRLKPGESGPSSDVAIDAFGYANFAGHAPATALSRSLAVRPHFSLDPNKHTCD